MSDCVIISVVEHSGEINFQLQWVGDLTSPPAAVNQMMITPEVPLSTSGKSDSHVLGFGYVATPIMPPNMSQEMAEHMSAQPLPVIPFGRFMFTTGRLRELRDMIDDHLQKGEERGQHND